MKPLLLIILFILILLGLGSATLSMAEEGFTGNNDFQVTMKTGTFCINGIDPATGTPCTKGFNPDNITCTDSNGDGWTSSDECSWDGSTSIPLFEIQGLNTQNGSGIIPGGSGASLGQTATQTIEDGPHFTIKYYNAPSAPGTTATDGVTSSSSAGLRAQHNEFGFEVVVDKKTDPLEPYYLKFYIPYTTVDSTQTETTGDITGNATGIYSKEITEMNPNNPGVFDRYTVTGTYTSTGSSYSASSGCDTGCTSDEEWYWRSQWP